jgi:hypothetical protein
MEDTAEGDGAARSPPLTCVVDGLRSVAHERAEAVEQELGGQLARENRALRIGGRDRRVSSTPATKALNASQKMTDAIMVISIEV